MLIWEETEESERMLDYVIYYPPTDEEIALLFEPEFDFSPTFVCFRKVLNKP